MSKSSIAQTDFGWSNIVHTLQCPACDFQTLRPSTLREHCTRQHHSLRRLIVFSCPLCHARATDVRLIDEHKRLYHTTDTVQAFAPRVAASVTPPVQRKVGRPLASKNIPKVSPTVTTSLPPSQQLQQPPQQQRKRQKQKQKQQQQPGPPTALSDSGEDFSVVISNQREPSASTSSCHLASDSSDECAVVRRTVRKSSIRAIAALSPPNLMPKESESSASEDNVPPPAPSLIEEKATIHYNSNDASSAKIRKIASQDSDVSPLEASSSAETAESKPRRDSRLCHAVRSHMDTLYARGIRRPDEMAAQLRRFVKSELDNGSISPNDPIYYPSMWTVRRLLKNMAAEESAQAKPIILANVSPQKRGRINLGSPTPSKAKFSLTRSISASPIKSGSDSRPRKIFTSSGPECSDGFPVVKLEESRVELVRCLKCGVRVPFQSDGTRAAQDAALMAHLANSHGIRKREPIVYPSRHNTTGGSGQRQRSQSAQDHVTDLDAEGEDTSVKEEVSSDVRILKECGVSTTAAAPAPPVVDVKLEGEEEVRVIGARILQDVVPTKSLKRPPADEIEDVALVAVRIRPAVKSPPPGERSVIDLDVVNGEASKGDREEDLELVAEFSDMETSVPDISTSPKEKEETGNESPDDTEVAPESESAQKTEAEDETQEESTVMETESFNVSVEPSDETEISISVANEAQDEEVDDAAMPEVQETADLVEDSAPEASKSADDNSADLKTDEEDWAEVDVVGTLDNNEVTEVAGEVEDMVDNTQMVRDLSPPNEGAPPSKRKYHLSSEGNWQCCHCFAGFEDERELTKHVEEIHH